MSVTEVRPADPEDRPVFRLAVDTHHRMIDAGIFDEDDRVELIDLKHRRPEVSREPGLEGYRQVLRPEAGEVVAPLLLPELQIRVDELW